MAHILIICTANICRSPVAEALIRDRLQKRGLDDWTVSSAGTWAQIRGGAAENSVLVMAQQGLDISDHQSRMVEESHLEQADLVLCMESGHAEALRTEFSKYAYKVYLLTAMVGQAYSVHDPIGEPLTAYERMAKELADLIDKGMDRIVLLAEENCAVA
ncbi:MAG: low molecular weight protein arginine phosphatase [Chloroflexi bacterium]|jgi:protein-tyrosine-phosphatase|nr:low molecular weight protein arginine phosphatase [Chloroflexota bacterium]